MLPPGMQSPETPQLPGGKRPPTAGFLVKGADKAERKKPVALLLFPVVMMALVAIVWWEPWNTTTSIPYDDFTDASGSDPTSQGAADSHQDAPATRPPVLLRPVRQQAPAVPPVWSDGRLPKFDLPRGSDTLTAVSGSPPEFLAIDGTVYRVGDGQQLATYQLKGDILRIAVSPDGKHAAVTTDDKASQAIILHSGTKDAPPKTIKLKPEQTPVRYLSFAGPDRLVAQLGLGSYSKLQIWDTGSGAVLEQIEAPSTDEHRSALSSDGEQLALVGASSIEIVSTRGGARIADLSQPTLMDTAPFSLCRGVGFSHDGTRIAALFPNNRIIVWSLSGQLLMDHTLVLTDSQTSGLQWLADDSGWLLHGNTVVSANPVIGVWQLKHRPGYEDFPHLLVDQNHMLVAGGIASRGRMVGINIPWDEITPRLKDATKRQPLFGAPASVRVLIRVASTRYSDAEEVQAKLAARLKQALHAQGIAVRESAECMLLLDYSETPGGIKELSIGDNRREQTGTNCRVEASLAFRRGVKTLWTTQFDYDSGTVTRGDLKIIVDDYATDTDLRNAAFATILTRIGELRLPSVVLDDRANPLPIRDSL